MVLVTELGDLELTPSPNSAQALTFHNPPHGRVRNLNVLTVKPLPNFLCPIDFIKVGLMP